MLAMHFHIGPTGLFSGTFFSHSGVPGNNLVPMITYPGCRLGQNRPWGNRNTMYQQTLQKIEIQNWVSFFLV